MPGVVAALLFAACLCGARTTTAQEAAVTAAPTATTALVQPPPRIPTSAFARNPEYWDLLLSPLGTQVLGRTTVDGRERVLVHDLATGKAVLLPAISDGQVDWFDWAGEGRVLLCLGWSRPSADEDVYVTRLVVVDLARRTSLVLGDKRAGPVGDDVLYVDPAGGWLLLAMQESITEFPAVFRFDLATGERTEVVKPRTDVWEWYADRDGVVRAGIGYLTHSWFTLYRKNGTDSFTRVGRADYDDASAGYLLLGLATGSDEGFLLSDEKTGRYALYKFNYATQQLGEAVYAHPANDVEDYLTSPDGRRVLAVYFTDDRERVQWLDPTMQEHQDKLERRFPGQIVEVVTQDQAGERLIAWVGGASEPGAFYLYAPASGQVERLASLNSELDPAYLAATEYTRYKARDGLEIPAYLTLPRGREPRGLPLIVMPHGGPYFVRDVLGYDRDVQFLANRGYAVLQPNFRGSAGYGTEFAARGEGQWGRAMQDDLDDGVDWLAQRGVIDPSRVCIVGSSYGGYAALWGVTRNPERYRCAASLAGVTDVARQLRYVSSQLSGDERGDWKDTVRGEKGFDLDSVSPLEQADKLTRPVLIAHGTKDETVLYKQSALYRDALRKAGKPHVFVEYAGEGHGLEDPQHTIDWLDRLDTFLQTHNPAR